ncbi:MAG: hypothetical protein EOO56_06110 [Hymenobacter sp.]|nr:MAG: hypothetical protein EOO56_06110 [Hymenobacter sp.]
MVARAAKVALAVSFTPLPNFCWLKEAFAHQFSARQAFKLPQKPFGHKSKNAFFNESARYLLLKIRLFGDKTGLLETKT